MSKAVKYLAWFLVGQAVQVILAILAKVSYMSKPILFSVMAGFLITVAIIAGVKMVEPPKPTKSYREYAEEMNTDD